MTKQKSNPPLVSVIVPNYNYARYLDKRMETILGQTYQNIEVIILDDCSTDNSHEVIERYHSHPKVREIMYNDTNSGSPFKQWDKGIHLATGDLIWIAESDDYCELNFLEELIKEWNKHMNVVMAFSNYVMFDPDCDFVSRAKEHKNRKFKGETLIKKRQIRYNAPMNASGIIFARKVYECVPKDFMSLRNAGDYMFWTYVMMHGNVVKVNKNLTYFRIHTSSVTGNNISKGIVAQEDKIVFDKICQLYRQSNFDVWLAKIYHHEAYTKTSFNNETIRQQILSQWQVPTNTLRYVIGKQLLWLAPRLEKYFGILL